MASLHESCNEIVSHVENTGHFLRDVRDFEDKIELETQNGVDGKLEQLVNNFCEVKQENETLMAQIRKITGLPTEYDWIFFSFYYFTDYFVNLFIYCC